MSNKKILKIIGIIVGVVIVIGIIGVCGFTGVSVFNNTTQLVNNESTDIGAAKRYFKKIDFDLEEFQSKYKIETIQIESTLDGHTIRADYITMDEIKIRIL
ncbi:hypothetical protein [Tissierella praeacuta]|uniref:hypothetical protein n=1 Tax=Tissierella praeacuta TaxID=43131 RepID=UPI00333F5283